MSGDTFDMNDLRRDFAAELSDRNKVADRAKKLKMIKEVVRALGEVMKDLPGVAWPALKSLSESDDPCEPFRDMLDFPLITGMDVYTGTNVKLKDLYSGAPKRERLWKFMMDNLGNYPGGRCFIVFRPRNSRTLWILTNCKLPHKGLVSRIVIPAPISTEDMTVISLDGLVADFEWD